MCAQFPDDYWSDCDREHRFPWDFYNALAKDGWIGIAIPEAYGGSGRGITEASILLEEVAASGAAMNGASSVHLSIFGMHPVVRHGSEEMKQKYLPRVAAGDLHVAFGVTEPDAGTDTTSIKTAARRDGDHYVVRGRKVWTTKALDSERVLLLTRTESREKVAKRTQGMTLLFAELQRPEVTISPIDKVGRNAVATCEVVYDDLPVHATDRVGEEGMGFRYLLDGLNAERILVASEALGIGKAAMRRAVDYANERVVFNRPIGMNQGVSFPLGEAKMRLDSGGTDDPQGVLAARQRPAVRRGSQHGEVAGGGCLFPGRGPGGANPRRLRLCQGVPRRALLAGARGCSGLRRSPRRWC